MRKIQELRADDNLVYTDTKLENGPVSDTKKVENKINKDLTPVIVENK